MTPFAPVLSLWGLRYDSYSEGIFSADFPALAFTSTNLKMEGEQNSNTLSNIGQHKIGV